MADIIILNGTSSSGKTTLAKALQAHFAAPYLLAGIDKYIFMLPSKYLNPPLWGTIYRYEYEGERITAIHTEALGQQLMQAMTASVAALAAAGFSIIVDHVILENAWLHEMAGRFAQHRAYMIGVQCPLEVLEQRERERRDRTLGQAAAHYGVVHRDKRYDFEVDTSATAADDCARSIWEFVGRTPQPDALRSLLPG